MKGSLWGGAERGEAALSLPPVSTGLSRSESMAVDAVGDVIEFWGFKRNQGRVWALLYLRGTPMSASEIEHELFLSKGGVSMLLRDLERWGVVHRLRVAGDALWRYEAETDLVRMVVSVIEQREAGFIARVRGELAEAWRLAQAERGLPKERLQRLEKMRSLAESTERALKVFLKTARLDVGGMFGVFRDATDAVRKGGK